MIEAEYGDRLKEAAVGPYILALQIYEAHFFIFTAKGPCIYSHQVVQDYVFSARTVYFSVTFKKKSR